MQGEKEQAAKSAKPQDPESAAPQRITREMRPVERAGKSRGATYTTKG